MQKEKQKMHKKILQLQKKLDAKQTLELEIQRLKGALEVMKQLVEDDYEEQKKLDEIKVELEDKEEELKEHEDLQQALVVKERKTNDELQDARKELVLVCLFLSINICVWCYLNFGHLIERSLPINHFTNWEGGLLFV